MGEERAFLPVKLFCGVICREANEYAAALDRLEGEFAASDLESAVFPFDFTDYYNREMGSPLFRRFVSFAALVPPERLAAAKLATNAIERQMTEGSRRLVNLDPGILSECNVIVATTKNYFHRVPLRDGIYAHLEYVYHHKELHPLEWTYPDFRSEDYRRFFLQVRELYCQALRR